MKTTTLVLSLSLLASAAVQSQPRLKVESTQLDIGTIYNGSSKKVSLIVSNAGDQDLQIHNIRTSCGCTAVKLPRDVLKPGESDRLEVGFDATGFRGVVQKYINIESNDPLERFVSVTLSADVREELSPQPPSSLIWLGSVRVGKQLRHEAVFINVSDQPVTIRKISTSSAQIRASAQKKSVSPGESMIVQLVILPEKTGYFGATFTIETASRNQPSVPMKVAYIGVTE